MSSTGYVTIPPWEPDDFGGNMGFPIGAGVHGREGLRNFGRHGVVTSWGRGTDSDAAYRRTRDPECLVDSEGPVVTWDDNGAEDWYPGQAMPCIIPDTGEVEPPVPTDTRHSTNRRVGRTTGDPCGSGPLT
jgi:hypothetical protein